MHDCGVLDFVSYWRRFVVVAVVVFADSDFVFSFLAKRLASNNISKMTYYVELISVS